MATAPNVDPSELGQCTMRSKLEEHEASKDFQAKIRKIQETEFKKVFADTDWNLGNDKAYTEEQLTGAQKIFEKRVLEDWSGCDRKEVRIAAMVSFVKHWPDLDEKQARKAGKQAMDAELAKVGLKAVFDVMERDLPTVPKLEKEVKEKIEKGKKELIDSIEGEVMTNLQSERQQPRPEQQSGCGQNEQNQADMHINQERFESIVKLAKQELEVQLRKKNAQLLQSADAAARKSMRQQCEFVQPLGTGDSER